MADQGASQARGISVPTSSTATFSGHNHAAAAKQAPFVRAGILDGLDHKQLPLVSFKLLGWDGATPVRWISRSYVSARDNLTNITVEDEWEVADE